MKSTCKIRAWHRAPLFRPRLDGRGERPSWTPHPSPTWLLLMTPPLPAPREPPVTHRGCSWAFSGTDPPGLPTLTSCPEFLSPLPTIHTYHPPEGSPDPFCSEAGHPAWVRPSSREQCAWTSWVWSQIHPGSCLVQEHFAPLSSSFSSSTSRLSCRG